MSKPRPILVGMLSGSIALSPVTFALGQQPEPAQDAIVIQSAGIDALLTDAKDAGLKRALMMLDDRLLELPVETGEHDMPAGMVKMVWDQLISPLSFRFGMVDQPEQGAAPFHAQLIVHTLEPGQARSTAGMIASLLEEQGAEWTEGPTGGVRVTQAPFGKMMLGAAAIQGRESLILGLNELDLDPPALDTSGLLPDGVRPVFAMHADLKQLTPMTEMVMQDPNAAMFRDFMESSGLMGQDAMIVDMAFGHAQDRSHGGVVFRDYARAGANWGALPGRNLPAAALRAIPADATYAQAGMFDWSKLPDMLRDLARQAGEEEDPFAVMASELGFNPDTDLIAHLGDTFVLYQSDTTGGGGLMSMATIVSLKNADAFAQTHEKIKARINQIGDRHGKGYVRIQPWREGDLQAFTIMTPGLPLPLEFSWAITGDHLVAGATRGAMLAAVNQLRNPTSSILDNKKVIEMAGGRLDDIMQFEYVDTPRHARQGYGVAQVLASAIANVVRSPSDHARDPGPIMLPYNDFLKGVQPMVSVGRWSGDDLIYTWQGDRSTMVNIAGAGGAMGGMTGLVMIAALGGVMLPALSNARQQALEIKNMATIRAIAQGLITYAMDQDQLPASLDELVEMDFLTSDMLISNYGPSPDGGQDFVYRTDLTRDALQRSMISASTVLLIDRAMLLNEGRTVVGFFDAHAELVDADRLAELLSNPKNQGAITSLGIPDWVINP